MARSHGVLKVEVWEATSDFRELTVPVQWTYAMLISQPQINNVGVLPYVPEKWVRYATGLERETLNASLVELRRQLLVVVDEETGELLVRTFVKHDRIWKQPNMVRSARKQLREVDSHLIREILVAQNPWLVTQDLPTKERPWTENKASKPLPEPLRQRVAETLPGGVQMTLETEGVPEPLAYTRDAGARARPQPRPLPQPPPQEAPGLDLKAVRHARAHEPLPREIEQQVQHLLGWIGKNGDDETPNVIRHYAGSLSEGALAKVVESTSTTAAAIHNRAGYVVTALKGERAATAIRQLIPTVARHDDARVYELVEHIFDDHKLSPDERIRLTDLAADILHETRANSTTTEQSATL